MTLSPMFLRFLTIFALVAGLVGVKRVVDSYEHKELHRKDFIQEYVLARALVDGQYPYPPVPDLIRTYFPDDPPRVPWAHPTPHTPPAALLSIPIGLFPYCIAVTIWVVAELICLAILVGVLTRWYDPTMRWQVKLLVFLTCLGFGPVIHELWYGQFSLILSVLVTFSWLSLRSGRDGFGGALLGAAVALKLAAWPVGLFLLMTRRWRAVLAAGAVVALLNLAAVGVMGPRAAADYYLRVGPRITKEYRQHDENFSLWTIGGRFFSPDIADVASVFISDPIVPSPSLDRVVTPGLPLFVLIVALVLAWRCREFDSAFGILVCASLPLNPVVWDHYLLLCAVPIVVILRRLREWNFPTTMTAVGAICLAIAIVPYPGYLDLAVWLFAKGESHNVKVLPFAAGLVTYLPLVSLAGWTSLLYATDGGTRAAA